METQQQDPSPTGQHALDRGHPHTPRSNAVLWGGAGAGLLLVAALLTRGFGLLGARDAAGPGLTLLVHRGSQILIPEQSPLRQRLVVTAAPAEQTSELITAPGTVEADPRRAVPVLPAGTGRVHEVLVALGDRVRRGQVLATIDSPDLAQAYDDDDKAAAAAALAARLLGYQEEQVRIGAASERDLEQARSENAQASAEYTRTRARLRAMGAGEGDHAGGRLLAVRAPVDGAITALAVAPGAMINDDTQALLTVADLSVVWVSAWVAEQDLAHVARDAAAEVTFAAYPGRTLHGKVLFVADQVDPDSRRTRTRIAFENPDYALKPNMYATVVLRSPPASHVVLPASALLMNNDRTSVFVAVAPWTFERRTVEPLLGESASVTIAAGVRPGEQVLVQGGILLND